MNPFTQDSDSDRLSVLLSAESARYKGNGPKININIIIRNAVHKIERKLRMEEAAFPSLRPNVTIARRRNQKIRRFSLAVGTQGPCLDSLTGDVLQKGNWTAYAMTTPFRINKERLRNLAGSLARQVMLRLDLNEEPEVAVRKCKGISSLDSTKPSILVRIAWTDKKVATAYTLISCAGTTDYSLLLFRGLVSTSYVMVEFLWQHFHCQVKRLLLPPPDLALFLAFWVSILESTSTTKEHVILGVTHPVITTCKLEMTTPLPKAAEQMKQLGIGLEIFEEDAEKFIDSLYEGFETVMPVDFSCFSLRSVHLPVASLENSGKMRFHNRESVKDVVRYLAMLANDVFT
ncbi:uncharacterized protein LOC135374960 [Ornithodoros turicata]|uniref:uncharacterized protein LOC135374960 n=1 Tax=Ornithodoros turicata TaxID=34597 RepID=UPI003139BEC9